MRCFRFVLLFVTTAIVTSSCFSQTVEPWLPLTTEDFQITSVPLSPGASAIQLYFSYYKDDDAKFISAYKRIKILTESGRKYADVEVPLEPEQSLKELKARTIHADGTIIEFTGRVFEKTIVKTSTFKYAARTFTLPQAGPGSIIEYSYVIALPRGVVNRISEWPIQGELFTLKERMRFRAFQGLVRVSAERNSPRPKSEVSYFCVNMPPVLPEKKERNLMELELKNMPAFQGEDYMPPQGNYKPAFFFFYGGRETASPEQFWQTQQKAKHDYAEKFIGRFSAVSEAAAQAIGSETDPEKKLRKLYARAQQIRNLSYERNRTEAELKAESLKPNASAQEVLQRGYGTSWEIDALFAALARAAGFDACIVEISDRRERSFQENLLWLGQLDGEAALVNVGGRIVALDPGTRFSPYGMLRWIHSGVTALSTRSGEIFITTPDPDSSPLHRWVRINLADDGSAKGEITIELRGQEALEHRIEALSTDQTGRTISFEEEIKAQLPAGATVRMTDSTGWEGTDEPLTAKFSVEFPSFGSVTGKRLVVPAYPFSNQLKSMFLTDMRQYPIVFSYPYIETDQMVIELPNGYEIEEPPFRREAGLSYASYKFENSADGSRIVIDRFLHLDGFTFSPEKYFELKNFFTVVLKGDESQFVVRAKTASAQTAGPR